MKKLIVFICIISSMIVLTLLLVNACTTPQETALKCDWNGSESFYGTVNKIQFMSKNKNCDYEGSTLIYCNPPYFPRDCVDSSSSQLTVSAVCPSNHCSVSLIKSGTGRS